MVLDLSTQTNSSIYVCALLIDVINTFGKKKTLASASLRFLAISYMFSYNSGGFVIFGYVTIHTDLTMIEDSTNKAAKTFT